MTDPAPARLAGRWSVRRLDPADRPDREALARERQAVDPRRRSGRRPTVGPREDGAAVTGTASSPRRDPDTGLLMDTWRRSGRPVDSAPSWAEEGPPPTVRGHLVAPRRRGDPWTVWIVCPYCSRAHTHGAGRDGTQGHNGHRVAHCGRGERGYTIEIPEHDRCRDCGQTVDLEDSSHCLRCATGTSDGVA